MYSWSSLSIKHAPKTARTAYKLIIASLCIDLFEIPTILNSNAETAQRISVLANAAIGESGLIAMSDLNTLTEAFDYDKLASFA